MWPGRIERITAPGASGPRPVQLLYIDSSHERGETLAEVRAWRPVMAAGSLIVFDDYDNPHYPGVAEAIAELGLAGYPSGRFFIHRVSPRGRKRVLHSTRGNPIPPLGIFSLVTQIIDVCPLSELGPGAKRLVAWEDMEIGVFNCGGAVYAIEDRCSHDDGPLIEGEFDEATCTVECPRHGSLFDLTTGKPRTLPAYVPVETFPVIIEDDTIKLEVE